MDQLLVVEEIIWHYAQKTHPIFCSHNIDHNRRLQENILWALASPDVLMPWFSHHVKLASQPGSLPRGLAEPKFWGQIRYRSILNPCILWTRVNQCPRDKNTLWQKDFKPPRQHKALIWLIMLRYPGHNHLVFGIVTFTMGWNKWWTTSNQVYVLYMWGKKLHLQDLPNLD